MNDSHQWMQTSSSLLLHQSFKIPIKHNAFKRLFDILFSLFVLILTLPLMLCIALAVRLSSKGNIVYVHERIGRGGKVFQCYKFRTMYSDADKRLQEILENCPQLKKEWDLTYKLKNDPRITPLGKFLRKNSLDEFPQFWNVIRGDLSVVGPRPMVHHEITKHLGPKATKILAIRPGLTGLWQVSGRSNTTYAERIKMDELYVDSQSLLLDIKIIAKTIPSLFFPKGAY